MKIRYKKIAAIFLALILIFSFAPFAFGQSSEEPSQQAQQQDQNANKDTVYTIVSIAALAAIFIGIREKKRGR